MDKTESCKEVKLYFDTSENFSGTIDCVYLSDIRDISEVVDENTSDTTDETTCTCPDCKTNYKYEIGDYNVSVNGETVNAIPTDSEADTVSVPLSEVLAYYFGANVDESDDEITNFHPNCSDGVKFECDHDCCN
jgi:hypothetical protein